MLRVLKTLCVLLKVLMLTRGVIVSSSEDLENRDIISTINYHYIYTSFYNFNRVYNYSDNVTVRNEIEGGPSELTFPRAFVEFDNRLNEGDIIITFRWKEPEFTNNIIQEYTVQYWDIENHIKRLYTVHNISATKFEIFVTGTPDTMFYFQVQAHNKVGAGPYTKVINVSTTHENPVPILLISSRSDMKELDIDFQTDYTIRKYRAREIIYSALEHKIYWITDYSVPLLISSDLQPFSYRIKNNTRIAILDISAHNLGIDWIARNLYWIQSSNQTRNIMKLDLTLWQQFGIVKYESIVKINEFKFLNILPSRGYFYWMELNSNNQYVIMHSNLDGKNMKPFSKNEYDKCSCSNYYNLSEASSMQIDNTNTDKPLMYWTSKDRLIAANINGCECNLILSAGDQIILNNLTIDKTNIYLFSSSEQQIYVLKKKYAIFLESKENAIKHVQKVNISLSFINQVTALDRSLQSYPPKMCLIPKREDYNVTIVTITANSIVLSLPEPILNPNSECKKYNLATTIYNISVSHCLDNDLNELKEFNVQTYELHYKIQNLTPFTEYTLKLALSNFYVNKLSMDLQFGTDMILRTTLGKLNAPENVTVQVLTPILAKILWMPPKNLNCAAVTYEVHWIPVLVHQMVSPNDTRNITYQMPRNKQLISKLERAVDGKFYTTIQPLLPGKDYLVYVRVYPGNFSDFFSDSVGKSAYMYPKPNNLILSGVSTKGMNISWIPSINLTIHYKLEYKNVAMQEWQIAHNIQINNDKVIHYIENLLPGTIYKFRLILRYFEYTEDFIWPPDERFAFETLGDVPSAPGIPMVTRIPNFMYQLNWEPAQARDSQVTLYRLEGLIVENNYKEGNQTDKNEHWNLYYNGTDNYWIITRDMDQKYQFRVQAKNVYGFGVWSESSAVVDLTESIEISAMQYYLPLILIFVIALVVYVSYFYCSYRKRKESNRQILPPIMTELATLYEIPHGNIQRNALYASGL